MDSFLRYLAMVRSRWVRIFAHNRVGSILLLLFILAGMYWYLCAAPMNFSAGTIVRIVPGTSVAEATQELADAHVISHPSLLRALIRLSGESTPVQTGVYRFATPQNIFVIAHRLTTGDYGLPPIRITFVEGATVREMAAHIAETFPALPAAAFLTAAQGQEGYLFPDTYFFEPSADATAIVAALRSNFDTKIAGLSGEISASGRSLADIVTLASLVEKEARTTVDRKMIAGILLNRLRLGMPLQVDAVFGYIFNRDTYSPTFADLKVNSPYNTYLHTGLPPGPIDNPGLDSIEAVLQPTQTAYLYYLTGKDGHMYYATTYAAHQANQKKYLQ